MRGRASSVPLSSIAKMNAITGDDSHPSPIPKIHIKVTPQKQSNFTRHKSEKNILWAFSLRPEWKFNSMVEQNEWLTVLETYHVRDDILLVSN